MSTPVDIQLMTADELLELGTDKRYELIEGRLVEKPFRTFLEGMIIANITLFIGRAFDGQVVGAGTGFLLEQNPDTVLAPALAILQPQTPITDSYVSIPPALVVEVVSPSDRAGEIEDKTQRWLKFGVAQVWVIYPNSKRIHIYEQGDQYAVYEGEEIIKGGDGLPNFEISVRKIFD